MFHCKDFVTRCDISDGSRCESFCIAVDDFRLKEIDGQI